MDMDSDPLSNLLHMYLSFSECFVSIYKPGREVDGFPHAEVICIISQIKG